MARNRAFAGSKEERDKTSCFKILVDADLSSDSMRLIPDKFRRSLCKNLPLKVILKVVWGRSWTVNLSENMGYYLMEKNGWEQFLNKNNLGDGEFLTFTNEGNNCLKVNIFDKSCKEILRPRSTIIASSSSKDVKIEEKNHVDPVIAESTRRGAEEKMEIAEEEEEEVRKKSKKKAYNNVYGASSSSSVATLNFTIKPSNLIAVTIPQDFAKKHMPRVKTKFILHDPTGKKSWEVVYYYSNCQKMFSSGWRILARDCDLSVGDICTLRLIKPREMVLDVLHASP